MEVRIECDFINSCVPFFGSKTQYTKRWNTYSQHGRDVCDPTCSNQTPQLLVLLLHNFKESSDALLCSPLDCFVHIKYLIRINKIKCDVFVKAHQQWYWRWIEVAICLWNNSKSQNKETTLFVDSTLFNWNWSLIVLRDLRLIIKISVLNRYVPLASFVQLMALLTLATERKPYSPRTWSNRRSKDRSSVEWYQSRNSSHQWWQQWQVNWVSTQSGCDTCKRNFFEHRKTSIEN